MNHDRGGDSNHSSAARFAGYLILGLLTWGSATATLHPQALRCRVLRTLSRTGAE